MEALVPVQLEWTRSLTVLLSLLVSDKQQEEKKDTFMEKLATQVIKNLQVKISSIHLRYEDDVSPDPRSAPGSSSATFLIFSFTDVCFSCRTHGAPYRWV